MATDKTLAGMVLPVAGSEGESVWAVIARVDSYLLALDDPDSQDGSDD